jgi:hypothetical protein
LCGGGIFELKQLVEITWVKQRGRYLPAICAGCFNRLWLVSVSTSQAPVQDSTVKPTGIAAVLRNIAVQRAKRKRLL